MDTFVIRYFHIAVLTVTLCGAIQGQNVADGNGLGSSARRWKVLANTLDVSGAVAVATKTIDGTVIGAITPAAATFTSANVQSLNSVPFAVRYAGDKLVNALADIAGGGEVEVSDGSYSTAGFTLGAADCSRQQTLIVRNATITLNGQIKVLCGGHIRGLNRQSAWFVAGDSFPKNKALIELGDGKNLVNDVWLENIRLNCNSVKGCSGIYARGINENSGASHVLIQNYRNHGIEVDGSAVNTANFILYDIDLEADTGASDGILLKNSKVCLADRITANSNSGAPIHAAGIKHTGASTCTLRAIHAEKHDDGVLVNGGNALLHGVDAGNGTVNSLRIAAGAYSVVANHLYNNANKTAKHVVKNDITIHELDSTNPPAVNGVIPTYVWNSANSVEQWCESRGCYQWGGVFMLQGAGNFSSKNAAGNVVSQFGAEVWAPGQGAVGTSSKHPFRVYANSKWA